VQPEGQDKPARTLTIAQAALEVGISRKAMERRVERGSVKSVLRGGRRMVPRSELARVFGDPPPTVGDAAPHGDIRALPGGLEPLLADYRRLVYRDSERRQIEAHASSVELELHESRARVLELEAQLAELVAPRRKWWRR